MVFQHQNLLTRCPVCNSDSHSLKFSASADLCASCFVPEAENPDIHNQLSSHIKELWGKEEVEILECNACEFGFASPYIGGDAKYYDLAYLRIQYPQQRWEYLRTIKELKALDKAQFVLELGAGDGIFLDQIVPWHVEPSGVFALDYHPNSVKTLNRKGYQAELADFLMPTTLANKKFDNIFMYQVLEHMDRSKEVFVKLKQCLNQNGNLFISVPNKRRTDFNEQTGALIDCPPNHIGRWTPVSFQKICDELGLELVTFEYEPIKLKSFILVDIYSAHRRRAMKKNSLAGKLRAIKNPTTRRNAIALESILFSPLRILAWINAINKKDLGGSLWVHIRNNKL